MKLYQTHMAVIYILWIYCVLFYTLRCGGAMPLGPESERRAGDGLWNIASKYFLRNTYNYLHMGNMAT